MAVALGGLVLGGFLLGGCFKRRVVREEPEEPTLPTYETTPRPVVAMIPTPPRPVAPPLAPTPTSNERSSVRDPLADAIAASGRHPIEGESQERQEERARRAEERAERIEAARTKEERMMELRVLVATAARKELERHAASLDLLVVDEEIQRVKFDEGLWSGTVAYRVSLSDTGLLGAMAATLIWTGKLTWELADGGEEVNVSSPHPKSTRIVPAGERKDAPKPPSGRSKGPSGGGEPSARP